MGWSLPRGGPVSAPAAPSLGPAPVPSGLSLEGSEEPRLGQRPQTCESALGFELGPHFKGSPRGSKRRFVHKDERYSSSLTSLTKLRNGPGRPSGLGCVGWAAVTRSRVAGSEACQEDTPGSTTPCTHLQKGCGSSGLGGGLPCGGFTEDAKCSLPLSPLFAKIMFREHLFLL